MRTNGSRACGTILIFLAIACSCAPAEKVMSYDEELQLKELREEGLRRSPQEQRRYECAEWHRRHPGSKDLLESSLERSYVPPECDEPKSDRSFDPMQQRNKEVDDIIDRQLRQQNIK